MHPVDLANASDELLAIGKQISETNRKREEHLGAAAELERTTSELVERHRSIVARLAGSAHDSSAVAEVEEEPIHSLADLASAGRARRRKPNALKWRIVKFLGGSGDPERLFSVQEIARAVGSKDNDVVQYALQDLRAKSRLLDRPIDGKWRLNEDGRREAATLP